MCSRRSFYGRKEMKMSSLIKIILCITLIFSTVSLFAGCGPSEENAAPPAADRSESGQEQNLISDENIERVDVSSMPGGYACSLDGDDAGKIISDISKLHLKSDFPENPDEYDGMTWVLKVRYKDSSETTLYLFGNMFIMAGEGPWYRMDYDEASAIGRQLMNASAK